MRVLVLLLFNLALFNAAKAEAHSPYLSEAVNCEDVGPYKLRIIHGDGILGPDPKALVVTDAMGRLVAYQSVSSSTILPWPENCSAADPDAGVVWKPVSEEFYVGPLVIGDTPEARKGRQRVEPGFGDYESFGFISEEMTGWSRIQLYALIGFNPLLLLLGLLGGVAFIALARIGRLADVGLFHRISTAVGLWFLVFVLFLFGIVILLVTPFAVLSYLVGVFSTPLVLRVIKRTEK